MNIRLLDVKAYKLSDSMFFMKYSSYLWHKIDESHISAYEN